MTGGTEYLHNEDSPNTPCCAGGRRHFYSFNFNCFSHSHFSEFLFFTFNGAHILFDFFFVFATRATKANSFL